MERHAAILEEGELGGAVKMAAPSKRIIPAPGNLEERQLDAAAKMATRKELVVEEVIVISDEEMERQDSGRMEWYDDKLQLVGQLGKRVSRSIRGSQSLDGSLCQEVRDGSFGSQSVFKVGEQVEFIDKAGVVIRGVICGETSGDGSIGRAQVLMDFWQAGVDEVNSECDAPRFPGGQSERTVHREAGRPSGGQSLSVKVRAPLGHGREVRVKSGVVYLTAREPVPSGSLGHGTGSVFEEQPSTSRGASARFESPDEEWLDFEEDVEERVIPALKGVVRQATQSVPEVVWGDRSGNRHREVAVGNLPRGEVGVGIGTNVGGVVGGLVFRKGGVDVSIQVDSDSGTGAGKSEVGLDMVAGGVPKEDEAIEVQDSAKSVGVVVLGARMEHVRFGLLGIPLFAGPKNRQLRGILVAKWVWMGQGLKLVGWVRVG
ncbi:hypothetical protein NDU88_001258 [Pleurodeles waltl]|uniref:Uncharacterized protein n=1 Tax=Pleurodeles waltl TaxID=8319 RepID=A0AAV7MKH2_PLEWA|nr:hypothetical protein NDU88_001258 [Pleurodeles waltl]